MNLRFKYGNLMLVCLISSIAIITMLNHFIFIRGFCGDLIFTAFVYFGCQLIYKARPIRSLIFVLLACYSIEVMQYFNVIEVVGLSRFPLAKLILGATFDLMDIAAYSIGGFLAYWADRKWIYIER